MREETHLKPILICVAVVLLGTGYVMAADPIFIAGSSGVSPPPFMENSFSWMSTSVERAFTFTVVSGGPYYVEELEVAVFNSEAWAGSSAYFTINLDNVGKPGQSIASFELDSMTTTRQIQVAEVTQSAILDSGSLYWLVGGASNGQVYWNLDQVSLGPAAYRADKGEWTVIPYTNVSAFAILGFQVPEPATVLLLGLGVVMLRRKR